MPVMQLGEGPTVVQKARPADAQRMMPKWRSSTITSSRVSLKSRNLEKPPHLKMLKTK